MEKIKFESLKNCYRIFNDTVDLIAPTEIGPSILRFGFVGDRNEFCVNKTDWGYGAIVFVTHRKHYRAISPM